MANIDDGFRIELLSLNDEVLIAEGTIQPNIGGGYEAPKGSLYLRYGAGTDGELWLKFGLADVDWQQVKTFPGGVGTLHNSSTGLINGGQLSINGGNTSQFDISAGNGIIVDHETDPLNPTYTLVTWNDIIGTTATRIRRIIIVFAILTTITHWFGSSKRSACSVRNHSKLSNSTNISISTI